MLPMFWLNLRHVLIHYLCKEHRKHMDIWRSWTSKTELTEQIASGPRLVEAAYLLPLHKEVNGCVEEKRVSNAQTPPHSFLLNFLFIPYSFESQELEEKKKMVLSHYLSSPIWDLEMWEIQPRMLYMTVCTLPLSYGSHNQTKLIPL